MPTEPENVVLVHLRRLSEQMATLHDDNREIKTRLGILEQQGASMSSRTDRIEFRLDRIEKRLDLVATAPAPVRRKFFGALKGRLDADEWKFADMEVEALFNEGAIFPDNAQS